MKPSTKSDNICLESAYKGIYIEEEHDCEQAHPGESHEHWEQSQVKSEQSGNEKDTEGEKMDAAIEIMSSKQDAKDQGKKMPQDLKRATDAADRYIDKKVQKLATEDMYSDRCIVIDKYDMRGNMQFIDEDLIEAIEKGAFEKVITGLGVVIYDSEETMVVLPADQDLKAGS